MEKVTTDVILGWLKSAIESKKPIAREEWLDIAFKLVLLRIDEARALNEMRQAVAQKRLGIMGAQDKRNVAAADVELQSLTQYREMRDQEDKLYAVDEFIRIAKKSSETNF